MPEETRTIGTDMNFDTRSECRDDINITYSGDITGEGDQFCEAYAGGSNNVFSQRVDWSGIICTADDRIIMTNKNSFIRNGIATFRHGTVFETTSTSYCVRMAEYMILNGFTVLIRKNQNWGYAAVVLNNYCVVKNCFLSSYGCEDVYGWAAGIGFQDKTGMVLANLVVLQITGYKYSFGISAYVTTGTCTLDVYHCNVFDMFTTHVTGSSLYCREDGGSLTVRAYNSFLEKPKGLSTAKTVFKYNNPTINMYNCCVEDGYVYGGSGNLTNKKVWKDCYLLERISIFTSPLSVLYEAGYNLNSDPNKAHFQYNMNGDLRDLTKPHIGAGGLKYITPADPQIPSITTSGGNTQSKFLDIEGTCQTQECVIKIYKGGGYIGQGVHSPLGQTTWKVENVELTLGDNVITATSKIASGDESAESSSITLTGIKPTVPTITTSPQEVTTHIDIVGTCQTEKCYIRIYIGGADTDQGVLSAVGETTFTVEGVKISGGVKQVTASAENDFGESAESSAVAITGIGASPFEGIPTIKLKVGSKILQEKDLMSGFKVVKFDLTKGDDAVLRLSLLDSEGAPLDLTSAVSVNLKVKENISDTSYVINAAMEIDDIAGGKVYYAIGKTIFSSIGIFIGEVSVTWGNGKITTSERRIEINVKPEL